jgi:putative endonuclease
MRQYYTYMMSNKKRGTLYTGMTNDLLIRVLQHKEKSNPKSFTAKYNLNKLVWYESFPTPMLAIRREKEIKGWVRSKKIALIEAVNPEWRGLYYDLVEGGK